MKFNDVAAQWNEIQANSSVEYLLSHGPYISGENVKTFEKEWAKFCGAKYAIGTSSGTDALKLAIQAIRWETWSGPHLSPIEAIIPANSHISSALSPTYFSLKTTVIDCDENHNMDVGKLKEYLEKTDNPKIVIITHMYGCPADMLSIKKILPDNCYIIEDCSHAHGATIKGQHVGTFGDIGIFSLYPTKNLGACGDAGIIITDNSDYLFRIGAFRNYGAFDRDDCQSLGWNNRLDEIQALILRKKLPHLERWNYLKYTLAKMYNEFLEGVGDLILPQLIERVFHIYQIRTTRRNLLQKYLKKRNIPTLIHYPTPIYKTEMFHHLNIDPEEMPRTEAYSQEILSLPIHPYLKTKDVKEITEAIKDFFNPSCLECGGHQELMENDNEGTHVCRWCIRKVTGETTDVINPTGRHRQV